MMSAGGRLWNGLTAILVLLGSCLPAWAHHTSQHEPELLRQVGIEQRLDTLVPLDLMFQDETGQDVRLGDYMQGKPVILTLAYYDCPRLCPLVLTGLVKAMRVLPLRLGQDFKVLTVSIDPRDTPEKAMAAKRDYLRRYGHPEAADGWHFLTGRQAAIARLAERVGFRYTYDAEQAQYAHASGLMVLTPAGKLARYFYGLEVAPRDLRLGLVEAAQHRIGTPIDQLLLLCYHYDPRTGQYGLLIMPVIRVAGLVTVLGLGMGIGFMHRHNRHHKKRVGTA